MRKRVYENYFVPFFVIRLDVAEISAKTPKAPTFKMFSLHVETRFVFFNIVPDHGDVWCVDI